MISTIYLRSLTGSLLLFAASLLADTGHNPPRLTDSFSPKTNVFRQNDLPTPGGTAEAGGVSKPLTDGTLAFCVLNGETTANLLWDAAPGEGEEFQISSTPDFSENVLPFQPSQLGAGTWYARVVNTTTQESGGVLTFTLSFAEGIQLTGAQATAISCTGGGAVDITVTGGSGQYAYAWSNDADATTYATEDLANLTLAATYTVVVTDTQSGCTAGASVAVTGSEPLSLTTAPVVSDVVCAGDATGQIEVTVQGGSGRYQFSRDGGTTWEPASPEPAAPAPLAHTYTFTGLGVGTYSIQVKDTGGCETGAVSVEIKATDTVPPTFASLSPITIGTDAGLCSAALTVPTPGATDNCVGTPTVGGTRSDNLALSAPYPKGLTTITWTATDAKGNQAQTTQTVTVSDDEAPAVPELAAASGCEVTLEAPTTTDNCAGTVTGTTTDPLAYTANGTYTVTWTFADGFGNASQATQQVVVYGAPTMGLTATGTTAGSASSANGPASASVSVCAGGSVVFSALSRSNNDHVGALIVVAATSGNVKRGASDVEVFTTPLVVAPANIVAYFSASYGPYSLSSGAQGTFQQVITPFYDVPPYNGTYDAGVDCLGVPVTVDYTVYAQPVLTIANPAATCAPGTVNLTAVAVMAGSSLPPNTTLSYHTDAAGTNALANPGAVTSSGTYYVKATSPGGCVDIKPVSVTVNPAPLPFNVTGGGGLCEGGSGVPVGLSGSQSGVSYQLKRGSTNVGSPVAGTGGALAFGNQTTAGTYTVVATVTATDCTATMTGSVSVSADPFGFTQSPIATGPFCAGGSLTMSFAVGCSAGMSFVAQLSNGSGTFTTPPVASWPVTPGTSTLPLPQNLPQGSGYRVRVVASNPASTSSPSASFTINALTVALYPATPGFVCQGQDLSVTFSTTGNCPFPGGNAFTAQLSNSAGSFASPLVLGAASPGTTTFPASLLNGQPAGTGYRVRIVTTNPATTSQASLPFELRAPNLAGVTPGVSGVPSGGICRGQAVTVRFTLPAGSCAFPVGNVFMAQLSSASGAFTSPVNLGSVQAGVPNSVTIPATATAGTGYRIRVVSSSPAQTSLSSLPFRVNATGCSSRLMAEELGLVVAPNPAVGGEIRCRVKGLDNPEFKLIGASGRPVAITVTAGDEAGDWHLRPAQQPAPGVYAVQVSEGQTRLVKRVMVVE